MKEVRELSLFTGMGGGIYGSLILGWKTKAYVEKNTYCQKIIKQRIKDGWFDEGKIYGDIKRFNENDAKKYTGKIDIITGGFPCQPFSLAGKRKGASDERYLFDEIIKTIKIVQPKRLFFENVPGILSDPAIIQIYQSLDKIGYQCKPALLLGSDSCGNIHRRKRVWIYASNSNYSRESFRFRKIQLKNEKIQKRHNNSKLGNTNQYATRLQRFENFRSIDDLLNSPSVPESLVRRMDDEFPLGRKRLKSIGNSQDPIVMATAYQILDQL